MRIAVTTYLCIFMAWLAFPAMASAGPGVEWMLTKADCLPGDVVELHARMTRAGFSGLEVKLPKTSGLHLVAERPGSLRYRKGIYSQEVIWVLQPTRAGVIELKGVKALLKNGETVTEFELPTLTLNVRSHPATADSFTPEPLPPAVEQEKDESRKKLAIGIAALVLLILLIIFRPKSKIPTPAGKPETTLDDVRLAMEAGMLPTAMIEQLLANPAAGLSVPIRTALERVVYDRASDPGALLHLMREEAAR